MKNFLTAFIFLQSILFFGCAQIETPQTKSNFKPQYYMGKWNEIARYENRFQKDMHDCAAEYALNEDGTIKVVNSGTKSDGTFSSIEGTAYAPDESDYSKLRVTFFWPFYSDYYVLDCDESYTWALVGSSDRDYLWILARENLNEVDLHQIILSAKSHGYDVSKFKFNKK